MYVKNQNKLQKSKMFQTKETTTKQRIKESI